MKKKIERKIVKEDNLLKFYFEINKLKYLYRQGWLKSGVSEEKCESVADHTFASSLFGWILAEEFFPKLDSTKILKMLLIHEIGEIYAGDFVPSDKITKEEKFDKEYEGVKKVFSTLKNGDDYINLWLEFEREESQESLFVKQMDKLEMSFQANFYENFLNGNEESFYESTKKVLKDKKIIELFSELQ